MVRKHADSPPVFFGTDEDVDLRGEIAEDKEVILDGHRFRAEEPQAASQPGEARAESPVHRLRNSRHAWLKAMHGLSLVCAMTLSIIESGYRLEWNEGGPPPPGISNEPPVHAPGPGIHRGVHPHGPRTGHDEGGL